MEGTIGAFALIAGATAVIVPALAALVNVGRLLRASGDHLVVRVADKEFVIDVGSIDRTDIGVIHSAARAVEERAKVLA